MAQGVNRARARTGEWKLWRFELTAYGKYVELSFEDVVLHTEADVVRWSRELMTAFEHYGRPVDLLVDLRGLMRAAPAALSLATASRRCWSAMQRPPRCTEPTKA